MYVYALTGGIASGKSTIAKMFAECGACILDADSIAKQVVQPGEAAHSQIVESFGSGVLLKNGELDRKFMRNLIFSDVEKKEKLNKIVHPQVIKRTLEEFDSLRRKGVEVVIYEAALIIESGLKSMFDGLIVVDCTGETQKKRLINRDESDDYEAINAINSQTNRENRLNEADYIINNSGSLEESQKQVEALWNIIRN